MNSCSEANALKMAINFNQSFVKNSGQIKVQGRRGVKVLKLVREREGAVEEGKSELKPTESLMFSFSPLERISYLCKS